MIEEIEKSNQKKTNLDDSKISLIEITPTQEKGIN
jgi:hypothetical protein